MDIKQSSNYRYSVYEDMEVYNVLGDNKYNYERIKHMKIILCDDVMHQVVKAIGSNDSTIKQRVLLYFVRKRKALAVYYLTKAQVLLDVWKLRAAS